jgi:glycosyltransferase involved in cell wall biosynthesis
MMDLLAIVPYYTAYLSKALLSEGVSVQVGSISYYLDRSCSAVRGLKPDPGLLDVIGKLDLPRVPRRILKLIEALINMAALSLRFLLTPPDIVHVQFLPMLRWKAPFDLWFIHLCRLRGAKIVLTVHDILPHDTAETYKALFQSLYRHTDALICHSDSIRTRLISEFAIPAEKIFVIPHGPFFYDIPPDNSASLTPRTSEQIVLWQGIIFPYKGVDLLLNAWQRVEAATDNARLVVLGTGAPDLLHQLRAQVQQLGLTRVTLDFRFASTEELVAAYRAADIVVYPYRAITTSGALATGLALGKTIVASDLPVFRELLTDRKDALLINPEETDELSSALTELLHNPSLRKELASAVTARDFGSRSWQEIAYKTIEVYDAVAKEQS